MVRKAQLARKKRLRMKRLLRLVYCNNSMRIIETHIIKVALKEVTLRRKRKKVVTVTVRESVARLSERIYYGVGCWYHQ